MQIIEEMVENALLYGYLHDPIYTNERERRRPLVLILAGGAYSYRSKREGEPVALYFLSRGYQAFILDYTTGRENIVSSPPEREVVKAISHLRHNSSLYSIDEKKIVLIGFSAGGHLALSSASHYQKIDKNGRPDYLVLSYPVVLMDNFGHKESIDNITNGEEEKRKYYSLIENIPSDLPPLFIWHTRMDSSVLPINTILLLEELEKKGLDYEYHIFQKGGHGLSVCTNEVGSPNKRVSSWLDLLSSWLQDNLNWEP